MLDDALTQRLQQFAGEGGAPLAVAFSGGGDSTALLHLLVTALKGQDREIHALIVDHKLRRGSGVEAKQAADRAKAMGAHPIVLKWIHDNPTTGIQEKARIARYGLMGDACRHIGVSKLFLGHNHGDQIETVLMRQNKASGPLGLAGMQDRVKAPVWPHLRGIEVLRPLLHKTREDLRAYNGHAGLEYIDDPSNDHRGFERIRIRQDLLENPALITATETVCAQAQQELAKENARIAEFVSAHVEIKDWGGIWLKPEGLAQDQDLTISVLRLLIPCVSGSGGFPPKDKVHQHIRALKAGFTTGITLGGARLLSREKGLLIVRDTGMVLGRHQKPPLDALKLKPNQPAVWDGRFVVETTEPNIDLVAFGRVSGDQDKDAKKAMKKIPLAARKTIPVSCSGHEIVNIPFVDNDGEYQVKSLISERLNGFLGLT